MAEENAAWPSPPREPGPWGGGPPIAPPGNTPLPPLPGASGTMQTAAASTNPWAAVGAQPHVPAPPPQAPRTNPFPGLPGGPRLVDRAATPVLVVAALVVVALIAGGSYVVLQGGAKFPKHWDPKVNAIAQWVQGDRELTYKHPVEVEFLTPAEYTKVSAGDADATGDTSGGSSSSAKPAGISQDTKDTDANLRALGFLSGEPDLDKANSTLQDSGSLAFYSPDTKKVYIRGAVKTAADMTPELRVTLAHELTHVLQDQYFDLNRISKFDSGQASTMRAVAEGDATRIEDDYRTKVLTKAEQSQYEKESTSDGNQAQAKLDKEVPPILTTVFAAPYILGPELVKYLKADGTDSINKALQDPPTDEVLFNPLLFGTPQAKPVDVSVDAPKGTKVIDSDEFGPTPWYLLLASRMDPRVALKAVDGWGGDHEVSYKQTDGLVCQLTDTKFDTPVDRGEFRAALATWVSQSPKGAASIIDKGDVVELKACDPGKDAKLPGTPVTEKFLTLPATRTDVYLGVVNSPQENPTKATCFANGVVDAFTLDQLNDEAYIESSTGQQQLVTIRSSCQ